MIRPFGNLADGRSAELIALGANDGLQAEILTYGGILHRLSLPVRGRRIPLVLTLPDLDAYVRDRSYQGVLVGRFGNRIAGAAFELDGQHHQLTANEGANQLHGGVLGFGKRLWRVLDLQSAPVPSLSLGLRSPADEEGYPGNLDVTASFTVQESELRLHFTAHCDAATPLNLTWHPYFNLSGDPSQGLSTHQLRIAACDYLPVRDAQLIPTGVIAPVAATPFDFRQPRPALPPDLAAHTQLAMAGGYDHCWVLDSERAFDVQLSCMTSGVTLTLQSDRPGLQFYGGHGLPRQHPGLHGLCLEPQGFPDAVNRPEFPSAILRPGSVHESLFRYRFST